MLLDMLFDHDAKKQNIVCPLQKTTVKLFGV